ncbi:PTS sugar transporter subunit IIA [Actinophytocola xinjiangensis]|uniref:Phosphocarrier protein HPr n=1 Tax=Actinophytocola xinjiangensis TaxID=485602 RepID=A0A7Z1AVE9_9PSEU|nr:dihydroxyacetone kinase phosphoryl donor subunit DhaM [Actinophytocola xinjiangensis]OLF05596.1 PTS sugar transporter subunit IIA [Actinophytocola xinjiangensis]
MTARVGLVVISHSARLAEGVAEVAGQMAPRVTVAPAGGADGGIGTDFDAVTRAVETARGGAGVVLLYDLGSARMVAELAVEALDDPATAVVVDAPLVEGAVAAAVAAEGGADLASVVAAARDAATAAPSTVAEAAQAQTLRVELTNEVGLHARPAALLARAVSEVDATVTVRFGDRAADATSVLALMALGARGGDAIELSATGPQADEALRRVADLAGRGFDD